MDATTTIALPMFGSSLTSDRKLLLLRRFLNGIHAQLPRGTANVEIWANGHWEVIDKFKDLLSSWGVTGWADIVDSSEPEGRVPLWQKECLLNGALLSCTTKYFAWIDPDVMFLNNDWHQQAIDTLSRARIVQLFSHASDLTEQGIIASTDIGIGFANCHEKEKVGAPYPNGAHCGYAWMARTADLMQIGGFPDYLILGGADYKIATGLLGCIQKSFPPGIDLGGTYGIDWFLLHWAAKARTMFESKDLEYVPGTLLHMYHGRKDDRRYAWRDRQLFEINLVPTQDLIPVRRGPTLFLNVLNEGSPRYEKLKAVAEAYFGHRATAAT